MADLISELSFFRDFHITVGKDWHRHWYETYERQIWKAGISRELTHLRLIKHVMETLSRLDDVILKKCYNSCTRRTMLTIFGLHDHKEAPIYLRLI